MAMFCPVCKKRFRNRVHCPTCVVVLQYQAWGDVIGGGAPIPWARRPWGRVALSVLLSMGLYFGFSQLLMAGQLVAKHGPVDAWALFGVLSAQVLQFATLFAGSMFAGAGERKGYIYGAVVGIWNGIGCALLQKLSGEPFSLLSFMGQPILDVVFGALGGLVGSWLWKPPHAFSFSSVAGLSEASDTPSAPATIPLTSQQVHWARVITGAAVAVGGVIWTDTILEMVLMAANHRISVRMTFQEQIVGLEISALAVFVGATLAGAITWNGSLQGIWVGVLSTSFLAGSRFLNSGPANLASIGLIVGGCLALSYLGGAFGARLFPPLLPEANEQSALRASA